jgi:hypothetical protein
MKNAVFSDVATCGFINKPTFRRNMLPPSSGQKSVSNGLARSHTEADRGRRSTGKMP